jgi:glycerol kinase
MSSEHLLALDLGTTGVRALVVDPEGAVVGRAWKALSTAFPSPGRVEQDAAEMWSASVEVMRRALSASGRAAGDLAAVGVANQRATVIAWDRRSGEPLAPVISWQDRRTLRRAAELAERGIPIDTLASSTKFEWLIRDCAEVTAAADAGRLCLGNPDAWLTWKLTAGQAFVTDPSNAGGTALYDLRHGGWSRPLLDIFGLEPDWLPAQVATALVVGATPKSLLGAEIPVAARAGDQQAASFAQGIHQPGEAKLTLGTSAMLQVHAGSDVFHPPPGTYPLPLWELPDGERAFCFEGSVVTAGAAVDWLVSLGLLDGPESLDRVAGSVPSSQGVVFVPALQGLGSPYMDPEARGLVGGLTRGSSAAELVRALVEGLAHRCVDLCDAMPLAEGPLRCDGGLARSDLLLELLSGLLEREVLRAAETETTALGAAFLAGIGGGVLAGPAEVRERIAPPTRFEPGRGPSTRAALREQWRRAVERARSGPADEIDPG